ncbi:hypothetical protein [Vibrio parahaemolyticus]|uniref:hypothetical protein n=1 Tax=Vibrio parahaemolyticus TaxID=670 RepID=UPI0023EAF24F|nr:hypothetical protein [Vibrio parahaemolyticus]
MKFTNFNAFKKEVAKLLKTRLGVDISNVDQNSLRESFDDNWTPADHVDLVASEI